MHAEVLKEISIFLADRPGELVGVLEAADAAGVDIAALCVSHHHNAGQSARGVVRLIGTPVDRLEGVCESLIETGKAGPMAEFEVLVVGMQDRPGAFRDIAAALATAGINVEYAYQTPQRNGHSGYSVFRVKDGMVGRAVEVVRDLP
ncbi:MAG: ACT domain-containing protein [Phycisphaeraceae bacterium]|nr:ACT domain-containing protein [Phycisphaeraceae bacterium]